MAFVWGWGLNAVTDDSNQVLATTVRRYDVGKMHRLAVLLQDSDITVTVDGEEVATIDSQLVGVPE